MTDSNNPYAQPTHFCDLVMKGGITSGVVYPQAILELARKYRFRSIGGASAGGIAAAAAAAAEYGRHAGGFTRLAALAEDLARPGRLLSLFQPNPETRPAFDLLRHYVEQEGEATAGRWARSLLVPVLVRAGLVGLGLGVVVGLLGGLVGAMSTLGAAAVGLLLGLMTVLVWLGLAAHRFWRSARGFVEAVRQNHFGMCTGLSPSPGSSEALTEYLTRQLDELAGLPDAAGPLTFRHLHGHTDPAGEPMGIELALMTCNLSIKRPVRFPDEEEVLLYKPEELAAFFPPRVMDALARNAPPSIQTGRSEEGRTLEVAPEGPLRLLPCGAGLPVVVAVRMSLSFPVLFSAVPLYTVKVSALQRGPRDGVLRVGPGDVLRNYFSDGGIVSNFPIHMFDSWLPPWPTFGINLADMPPEAFKVVEADPASPGEQVQAGYLTYPTGSSGDATGLDAVHLPRADEPGAAEWRDFHTVLGLAKAIFYTAKNHRDNAQSDLPSYRERIVTVRLRANEGSLNLGMPGDVIREVQQKGAEAGRRLASGFCFDHHRWVRFLVIMAQLERELKEMLESFATQPDYERLLTPGQRAGFPFPQGDDWCARAWELISAIRTFLQQDYPGHDGHFDNDRVPRPEPIKRLVPRE